jgi:hypothetical protein
MMMHPEQANPKEKEISEKPSQPADLETSLSAKQADQRGSQFDPANQQHCIAERNAKHGFGQKQDRRVTSRDDKPHQCRCQQDSAGGVDEEFDSFHGVIPQR